MWTPLSLDRSYARRVRAAGYSDLLVQRVVRRAGHCRFSELEEGLRALFDLTRWVTEGVRPRRRGSDRRRTSAGRALRFTSPFDDDDPLAPSARSRLRRRLLV